MKLQNLLFNLCYTTQKKLGDLRDGAKDDPPVSKINRHVCLHQRFDLHSEARTLPTSIFSRFARVCCDVVTVPQQVPAAAEVHPTKESFVRLICCHHDRHVREMKSVKFYEKHATDRVHASQRANSLSKTKQPATTEHQCKFCDFAINTTDFWKPS